MPRYKTKYKKDVRLDAVLVHAAIHGQFVPAAIQLGLTADEAWKRAYWLKSQSEDYINKVADAVVAYEKELSRAR